MDPIMLTTVLVMALVYNVAVDAFIFKYLGREQTNAQYMGAYGPADNYQIQDDSRVDNVRTREYKPIQNYAITVELIFYTFIHTVCGTFIPGYFYFMFMIRYFVAIWEFCRLNVIYMSNISATCWKIAVYMTKFLSIGNWTINQINKILPKRFRLKKSVESLTTWSFGLVAFIGLGMFYVCKKLWIKEPKYTPQANKKETRGQAMVNLGLMIIAFIGWSDFGMWKKFQDWIRMSQYVNHIFGDAAADDACSNYDIKKFNKICHGKRKGENLCLGCSSQELENDPQVKSRVVLNFSEESIFQNPGSYYYPLVSSLLKNQKEIPLWYSRLPEYLQDQIFESHYQILYGNDTIHCQFPKDYRMNREKLYSKSYEFRRDETVGKWIIKATDKNGEEKTVDGQFSTRISQDLKDYKPQCGGYNCQHDPIEEKYDTNIIYVEAFVTAEDQQQDVCDTIPFLKDMPKMFTPCVFICAMCLILYGTYYWHRKRLQEVRDEEGRKAVAEAVVKLDMEMKQREIPPVIRQLRVPDPDNMDDRPMPEHGGDFRQRRLDNKSHRYDRHGGPTSIKPFRNQEFDRWKDVKQRSYFCYDITDLNKLLEERGVPMLAKNGDLIVARTQQEFRQLISRGYTPDPQVMNLISKGSLDLRRLKDDSAMDFLPFHKVVSKQPLSRREFEFINDLIPTSSEDKKDLSSYIEPDWRFEEIWRYYEWDRYDQKYIYTPPPSGPENGQNIQILSRAVEAIQAAEEAELSKPFSTTPEEYVKLGNLVDDIIRVQGNDQLAEVHKKTYKQAVVSRPESNVSTVESDDCPFGIKCTTHRCPKKHPAKPESFCGPVLVPHYSHLQKVDPNNSYGIFYEDFVPDVPGHTWKTIRWGNCSFSKLGFITQKHNFYEDPIERTKSIPYHKLYVFLDGKYHNIIKVDDFEDIEGHDGKLLPPQFQDQVCFKIENHFEVTKNMKQAKARVPKDGDTAFIVTLQPIENGVYRRLTQPIQIRKSKNSNYYWYKCNTYGGDSGSPIYDTATGNLLGTHYGECPEGNAMIPINQKFIPNINGGQELTLSKKYQPTL